MKRNKNIIFSVLIVALAFGVYSNGFKNEFVYDDVPYVYENIFIRDLVNVPRMFSSEYFLLSKERTYRPVCTLSFMADYALWKYKVPGWRLTNILVHALNALLLFLILNKLTGRSVLAFVAGMLFAVHPVQSEAVLVMSFREDELCLLFCLLSLGFFVSAKDYKKKYSGDDGLGGLKYIASVAFYAVAVFTKEMAMAFILVFPLCDLSFRSSDKRIRLATVLGYLPYVFVAAAFMALKYTVFVNREVPAAYPGGNVFTAMLTMSRVIVNYAKLLLYPVKLNLDYVFRESKSLFDRGVIPSMLFVCSLFAAGMGAYRKSRIVFFSIMFFFINLIAVSNIMPFGAVIAERYLYFSAIGFFALAGYVFDSMFSKKDSSRLRFIAVTVLLVLLVSACFLRTYRRGGDFKDGLTLWTQTIKVSPGSYTAHNNLGVAYKNIGMINEALREHKKTLEINPNFVKALNNIGYIYYEKGRYDESLAEYAKAVQLEPGFSEGYLNMGLVYYVKAMYDQAIESYKKSVELDSNAYRAYSNLIAAYAGKGDYMKSIEAFEKGVRINPNFPDFYKNIGLVYKLAGDTIQTVVYWKKYLSMFPDAADAKIMKQEIECLEKL